MPSAAEPRRVSAPPAGKAAASGARGGVAVAAAADAGGGGTGAAAQPPAPRPLPDLTAIRGMLFDIDGTLTDSDPLHFLAFQQILAEAGFDGGQPIDEAFFRSRISGRHNPEIAADLFPDWTDAARVAFYTDKEARFRRLAASKLQRMAGLTDWIDWLRARGVRMAAVTNAPRANTEQMLTALGLDGEFEAVVLGEECVRAKPHPDPYQRAMEALGLAPHECLVVEDSPAGLRAAVAAGVPAVGITTGQAAAVLDAAGACLLISSFHDLLAVARRHEDEAVARSRGGGAAAAAAGGGGEGGAAAAVGR